MGVRSYLRHWLLEGSSLPVGLTERGSQQSVSPENSQWMDRAGLAFGVPQPWNLTTYLDLYEQDSTCAAVVNALTSLTLSEITVSSEAAEDVDRQVLDFNRRIGLHGVLDLLISDYYLYGFACSEVILTQDASDILGLLRIDPRTIRVSVDIFGRITAFLQLPWLVPNAMTITPKPITLNTDNILFFSRKPIKSIYGTPTLAPCSSDVTARSMLSTLSYRSAKSLSFPTPLHTLLPSEDGSYTKDDYQEIINGDIAAWRDAEPGDHIHRVGKWEDSVFAPSDHLQQVGEEIENFNSQVISASGLNANAVGLNYSKGWTPSTVQTKLMVNQLRTTQILLMEALNRKLYSRYSDIYNTPAIFAEMKQPTLESQKEEQEAYATLLNNVDRLSRLGIISPGAAAGLLGYDTVYDNERMEEYLTTSQAPQSPVDQGGDRNQQQRNSADLANRSTDNAT